MLRINDALALRVDKEQVLKQRILLCILLKICQKLES